MKISKILPALAICALSLGTTACNDNDDPGNNTYSTIAFVDYMGTGTNGQTTFLYSEPNSNKTYTLLSAAGIKDDLAIGRRIVISVNSKYGEEMKNNMEIDVTGAARLNSYGNFILASDPGSDFLTGYDLYLQLVQRAGNYVDVMAYANPEDDECLKLYVDQNTVGTSNPQAYLIYTPKKASASNQNYYASFNIADIVSNTAHKKLTVHVKSANLADVTQDFTLNQ